MSSLDNSMVSPSTHSPLGALKMAPSYIANIRKFRFQDWVRYVCWIGTLSGLVIGTVGFTLVGYSIGVDWPGYVWVVPVAATIFCSAIAIDDIGHRTLYKEELVKGEGAIHQMIVATAVPSVIFLCFCYQHPQTFRMPALGLMLASFFYTAIDEAMHWVRYTTKKLDIVEMWAHFLIITGHVVMMLAWWQWYEAGYPGVAQTLAVLPW